LFGRATIPKIKGGRNLTVRNFSRKFVRIKTHEEVADPAGASGMRTSWCGSAFQGESAFAG